MDFFLVGLSVHSLSTGFRLCANAEVVLLYPDLTYHLWGCLHFEKVEDCTPLSGRQACVLNPLYLIEGSAQPCLGLEGVELDGLGVVIGSLLFYV